MMPLRHDEGRQKRAPVSRTSSWEALWERAYRLLQSGPARGWQPADWEDMAQDAVCKAIVALQAGQVDESRFDRWFTAVVIHLARDEWRLRHGRASAREHRSWEEIPDLEDTRQAAEFEQILAQRDVQMLLEHTPALRPHERAALTLWYWYGCSDDEIADVLGARASTVRGWLRDARVKLRRTLDSTGTGDRR
jgi:RNA polymerase sigma factor (sigma-70 family)